MTARTHFTLARLSLALRLVLLLLVAACSARPNLHLPGGDPRPPPDAVAVIAVKRPTLARVQGNLWVVGLPQRHGWARERRVLLTQRDEENGIDVKVGVVVVLDDSYATAAPVGIVYEEPGASFDGAVAAVVGADQRLRVGRGFGTLAAVVTTSLVEINLGSRDGVGVGDVYEVRSSNGTQTIGRVKVTELEDTRAKATVLNAGPMAVGQEVAYQPKSAQEQAKREGVRIVVCNFTPKAQDLEVARAGQAFAFDLAKHLREAAASWQGLEVMQVPQMVSDHEPARALGRSYQADIVVWGTAMCFKEQGCALPVYTVVEPGRLASAERSGREVRFDPLSPGSSMERGSARDPAGIVFGLLGSLAFDAQHYGDAAFYLGRVPEGALEGDDAFRALRDLGDSQYFLGRIESALDTAGRLERAARDKNRGWEAVGVGQRASILTDKGQVDEALKLHREELAVYEALGDRRSRAVTLGDIARLLTNKGQEDEALTLHRERLAVYEALGDRRNRAVTLGDIARLLTDKGQVDEALTLHRERLAVYEALGARHARAVTLGDIARLLTNKGQVDEALKLHREELAVYEALGARRLRTVTLVDIARLLTDKGQVDEALKLHREALAVFEALGARHWRSATLFNIAKIHLDRKDVTAALPMLRESYEIALGLGDAFGTASIGDALARTLIQTGAKKEAEPVVDRAAEALTKIGKTEDAEALRALLAGKGARRP